MLSARVSVGLLAALGCLAFHAQASAVETVWPGALCVPEPGSGTLSYWFGEVANSSTSSELTVICPISKTGSFMTGDSYIKVFPRNATISTSCKLAEAYVSGSNEYVNSDTENTGTVYGSASYTFHFGSLASGYDFYWAECTLPRVYNGAFSQVAQIGIFDQ